MMGCGWGCGKAGYVAMVRSKSTTSMVVSHGNIADILYGNTGDEGLGTLWLVGESLVVGV